VTRKLSVSLRFFVRRFSCSYTCEAGCQFARGAEMIRGAYDASAWSPRCAAGQTERACAHQQVRIFWQVSLGSLAACRFATVLGDHKDTSVHAVTLALLVTRSFTTCCNTPSWPGVETEAKQWLPCWSLRHHQPEVAPHAWFTCLFQHALRSRAHTVARAQKSSRLAAV
jgi:hypothetical protein